VDAAIVDVQFEKAGSKGLSLVGGWLERTWLARMQTDLMRIILILLSVRCDLQASITILGRLTIHLLQLIMRIIINC
jgi:hypothetical protein